MTPTDQQVADLDSRLRRLEVMVRQLQGKVVIYTGEWRWTTGATATAAGDVGMNAASWAAVTQINLSKTSEPGVDLSASTGGLKLRDQIYLQDKADASNKARFQVTGPGVDHGSWVAIPVSLVASSGAPPANNALTDVSLVTR